MYGGKKNFDLNEVDFLELVDKEGSYKRINDSQSYPH
jgi:hypothetical protein